MKEKKIIPVNRLNPGAQIVIEIGTVSYGYQLDIQIDGKHVACVCADWGGDYKEEYRNESIAAAIIDAMKKVERNYLDK